MSGGHWKVKVTLQADMEITLDLHSVQNRPAVQTFGPQMRRRFGFPANGLGLNTRRFELTNPRHPHYLRLKRAQVNVQVVANARLGAPETLVFAHE